MSINHSFDISLAAEYDSIQIAILIHHFQHWIMKNKRLKRNFIENRTWTYQTQEEISAHFTYWSVKQVERLLQKMIDLKILRKGNFNKTSFDRTKWYCFENEEKFGISRIREMDATESVNGYDGIGRSNIGTDTKTDTKTDCLLSSPVGSDFKEKLNCKLIKKDMSGRDLQCSKDDVFRHACSERKNWKTSEIEEAWNILANYNGPIREYIHFISGTIDKLRMKERSNNIIKKENSWKKSMNTKKEEDTVKETKYGKKVSYKDYVAFDTSKLPWPI